MTAAAETRARHQCRSTGCSSKRRPRRSGTPSSTPGLAEKYGYACRAEYDLRPGGAFKTFSNAPMKAHGVPDGRSSSAK